MEENSIAQQSAVLVHAQSVKQRKGLCHSAGSKHRTQRPHLVSHDYTEGAVFVLEIQPFCVCLYESK